MAADFSVLGDTRLDNSGFESGIKKLTSTGLKIIGTGLATATAGIAAFGAYSIKSGMEFDTAMSQVAATMGTTVDQIDELSSLAKEMGATTKFTATEAAEGLNYLALAGYDTDQQIAALPTVLNLAAAGSMELATASDLVTDAMSALGMEATQENLEKYADQMAKTASNSNTNVQQLGEATLVAGGQAKLCGMELTDMNAALGILADNGIKGSEGGTALRNVLKNLYTPTSAAQKAIDKLGVSTVNADGTLRNTQDVLQDLSGALDNLSEADRVKAMNDIFDTRTIAAANNLLGASGERWDELAATIEDSAGACEQMAATQLDNLEGDVTLLQSAFDGFAQSVYTGMQPALREFVQFGTDAVGQLQHGFEENCVDGLMDALGSVLGQLVTKVAEFAPTLISLAAGLLQALAKGIVDNWPVIQQALRDCLDTVLDGITELIPALTPVSDAIKWIADNIDTLVPIVYSAITAFIAFKSAAAIFNLVKGFQEAKLAVSLFSLQMGQAKIASAAMNGTLTAFEAITALLTGKVTLAQIATAAWAKVQSVLNGTFLASPITWVVVAIVALVAAFIYLWNTCEPFKQFWLDLWHGIQDAFAAVVEFLGGCVDAIVAFFTETIPSAITAVGEWFSGLLQNLSDFFTVQIPAFIQGAIDWFLQLPTNIAFAIGQIIGYIILFGINLLDFVTTTIPEWFNNMVAWFAQLPGAIWTWLCNAITNVIDFGAQLIANAVAAGSAFIANIVSFFTQLPGNVASWLNTTISNVAQFASNLASKAVQAATGFCTNIRNGLAALPGQMLTVGSNIVTGIWNGIKSGWTWLTDSLKNLASSLLDGVKSVLGIHSPSKKFAWIGKMSAVGMEQGFEDEDPMGTIKGSLSTQMGNLKNKFTINAQNTPGGNVTQNIDNSEHITFNEPVKTPSETARTIYRQRTSGLAGARA